jgi:hypothetical protein
MLVTLGETPLDAGQVRMINIAAFDQPDEAFVIRILDSQAMAGADAAAHFPARAAAAHPASSRCGAERSSPRECAVDVH